MITFKAICKDFCFECNAYGRGVRFTLFGDDCREAFLCITHFGQNLEMLEESGALTTPVSAMPLVCLLRKSNEEQVDHLSYADGKVRTYRPDDIDPRTGDIVFVQPGQDMWEVLEGGALCAVPVPVAMRELCWSKRRFAELS